MGRVQTIERLCHTDAGPADLRRPGRPAHEVGTRVQNPDLARTLSRIADHGAEVFYTGDIAREIAADMERHGGLLSLADLERYKTSRVDPLWGEYRGYRIATNRPPGGGVMLLEMLHVLEHFDLAALGHNSAEYMRVVCEAMKRATIDKDVFVGDPDFVDVPVERLTGSRARARPGTVDRAGRAGPRPARRRGRASPLTPPTSP